MNMPFISLNSHFDRADSLVHEGFAPLNLTLWSPAKAGLPRAGYLEKEKDYDYE